MELLGKDIKILSSNDILWLRENKYSERITLDYKLELDISDRDKKREFLYDITAFANTEGGILLFGIEEEKDHNGQNLGIPKEIKGVTVSNKDKEFQRIEALIRDSTDPQINSIVFNLIIVDRKEVLAIGIRKYNGLPHMVTFSNTNKFYKRNNTGKYLVPTSELSELFMKNFNQKERATSFVKSRIREGGYFDPVRNIFYKSSYLLHIIPLDRIGETAFDISSPINENLLKDVSPIESNGYNSWFNLEGLLNEYVLPEDTKYKTYCQIFRDGTLEFYTSLFYSLFNKPPTIDGKTMEECMIESVKKAIKLYHNFKINPPLVICLNLFKIRGFVLTSRIETRIINRDDFSIPPILITDFNNLEVQMKPFFDIFWQAAGSARSPYYFDDGSRNVNA